MRPLPWYGWIALAALIAAKVALWERIYAVEMLFYPIVWWSYIFFVDAVVWKARGSSLARARPRELASLAFWSVAFWNLFELFNVRLQNWFYVNVAADPVYDALMSLFAYSTVLPGILETYDLVRVLNLFERVRTRPWRPSPRQLQALQGIGIVMLVTVLIWPRYTFPLVWIFLTLAIDPICYRSKGRSLLGHFQEGDPRPFVRLLAAGLLCGLLWELWNYWAHTKWIYTVPFFEHIKLFEMPPLGFLGFPPFAIGCYAFANLLSVARRRDWDPVPVQYRALRGIPLGWVLVTTAVVTAIAFNLVIYAAIDLFTIQSYSPRLAWIHAVPAETLTELEDAGIDRPEVLLERTETDAGLAEVSRIAGIDPDDLRTLRDACALIDLQGLGADNYNTLRTLGIATVADLARQDADVLVARWPEAGSHRSGAPIGGSPFAEIIRAERIPTAAQLRFWIRTARERMRRSGA